MASILDQDLPDEESEDEFNPAPELGSDDEADDKPEANHLSSEDAPRSRSRTAPHGEDDEEVKEDAASETKDTDNTRLRREDDAEGDVEADGEADGDEERDPEEDEDEGDEDDEDEDEGVSGRSRKRRRKDPGNRFIDVEAEVDDEDEEEPEEDEEQPGEEMHPDDLQELPPGADKDDRKHRELDRQRDLAASMDAEKQAAMLKERYGRQSRVAAADSMVVPQRLLMPSVDDPRIWRIKCRPGKEREIIVGLNARMMERAGSKEPLEISSCFERGGVMAGNLYVEAMKVESVAKALEGLSHVFMGTKPLMIPLEEMPDLLRTRKSKSLEPGMYVRPRRGLYQGDLAQVDSVETNGLEVTVKLVPRLDYGLNEDANAPVVEADGPGGAKRKRTKPVGVRPPPRLFSENEARKKHGRYLSKLSGLGANGWTYQSKTYIEGFLLEDFKSNALVTENVNPTLEEVTKFVAGAEDGTENLDLAALAATLKASTAADFLPGDMVRVHRGEQAGVEGRAVQVYGDVVKIKVDAGPLRGQTVEAPVKELRKLFREGDHVKVIGGSKYFDEVGMVVKLSKDGDRITLLTDSNQSEITVFSKDLREATDAGGQVGAGKFDLFDLVQLDPATVGIIIKVDRESLRVLDQTGTVRTMLPSAISNKLEKRRYAVATDHEGNEMRHDDTIRELSGERRQGRVMHLHRIYVFAQNRERTENAGIFVQRHNNVVVVAAKGGGASGVGGQSGLDLTKQKQLPGGPGSNGAMAAPAPRSQGRDKLIGKSVRVKVGPYKGLIGLVKDATDLEARVEFHAKNKTMNLPKDKLAVLDGISGQVVSSDARSYSSGVASRGLPPSMAAGRTPMAVMDGRTPFANGGGGRTPAYAMAGGRTPAWRNDGGRTPAYAAGGQTAYGGGGGSTAYGGGQTSYGGGSVWGGGQSSWNPNSSRTPAHNPNDGGRTPAYATGGKTPAGGSGSFDAPTPGINSAPTPGGYQDQPTPGGFRDQPTPGGFRGGQYAQTPGASGGSYQTPGAFPQTPGGGYPETPGTDGPSYD